MPCADFVRSVPVKRTPRVLQLEGLFEVPPTAINERRWRARLPIDDRDWNIGLVVGPSGCGKSTLLCEMFGEHIRGEIDWPQEKSVVDTFPASMGIKEITGLLSSVGFSSPPSWLRPFRALSTGEQFRVTLARTLAEESALAVVDEFTSVIDRTAARIGSAAVAAAVRRMNKKLVAASCHYDVMEWLAPDWTYEPASGTFSWRSLRRRPRIILEVFRAHRAAWRLFAPHHYLARDLAPGTACFVGLVEDAPAAFASVIHFPHADRPGWREHRTVCLPDFQGVGIGNALSDFVAGMFAATGKPYRSVTSHPAMIGHRARSPLWRMTRSPSRSGRQNHQRLRGASSHLRMTASFEFVGPARMEDARAFGIMR